MTAPYIHHPCRAETDAMHRDLERARSVFPRATELERELETLRDLARSDRGMEGLAETLEHVEAACAALKATVCDIADGLDRPELADGLLSGPKRTKQLTLWEVI